MITRQQQMDLYVYNLGIQRAREEYANHPGLHGRHCPDCTTETTCAACRRTAKADILVATSFEECAELLEIIDRPTRLPQCGTPAGYQAHRKRGERACARCRRGWADYCAERRARHA